MCENESTTISPLNHRNRSIYRKGIRSLLNKTRETTVDVVVMARMVSIGIFSSLNLNLMQKYAEFIGVSNA